MQNKRPVVVILGMHRSGTSLIANFMHAVGVDFGLDLMPADESNAAGYWESMTIFETHQKILKELNCDWHNPPLSLPADCWRKPVILELKSGLVEFVRSECERTDKIWGFKDPRVAVLLPLWQEIFDELQLEPLYLLSVRHPGSVAASLARRDSLALADSQALWLKTYLDALSHTGNHLLCVVDYDRWFESGLEQAGTVIESLNLSKSITEEQIVNAVNNTIQPGLRHHSSKQNATCSPIVDGFYSLLRQAAIDGKVSDEIWTLTETFEKARGLLNTWDELVAERDKIIADNKRLLRKQRKRRKYSDAIIIVFIVVFAIYTFVLIGAHNWFK
jgi:hypothetical protein